MPPNINDKITHVALGTRTYLASPGYTIGDDIINCNDLSEWEGINSAVIFAMDVVGQDGKRVEGTYTEWKGILDENSIGSLEQLEGIPQDYQPGENTRVYVGLTASWANELATALEQEHNRDGTHSDVTADSVTTPILNVEKIVYTGSETQQGWDPVGTTPVVSSGYNKGNKEFDLIFDDIDLTQVLSPGMRFKLDRNGTVPTKCADFESSNSQYTSKAAPSGLTFTDDFTCEAWIKLESYTGSNQVIVSRFNSGGTTGWYMSIDTAGRLVILGATTGGGTNRGFASYQSIPLGQWVHVAATLDMSGNVATTYINGVSVANVSIGGTSTALINAGDILIGARATPTEYFDGKISDVRLWSAIRTATQIRDNINQQLVGNESGLQGYWKLNNDFNDATSNANHLAASGGATATNSDHPFSATEYALITSVTFSSPDTTIKLHTGDSHNIPNMTLLNPYFSTHQNPYNWPGIKWKWKTAIMGGSVSTSSTSAVQIPGLSIPVSLPVNRDVNVKLQARDGYVSANGKLQAYIWEGVVGSGRMVTGTALDSSSIALPVSTSDSYRPGSSAVTYNGSIQTSAGTGVLEFSTASPLYLTVEIDS